MLVLLNAANVRASQTKKLLNDSPAIECHCVSVSFGDTVVTEVADKEPKPVKCCAPSSCRAN